MQVALTTRRGNIPDSKREYITSKAEKLLTYFERVTSIQVLIDFEKDRATVEVLVDAEHKHNFVASDVGEDVVATFDQVMRKMEQQIRKYKERIQDHRRLPAGTELAAEGEDAEAPATGEETR